MPGLRINIDNNASKRALAELRKELKTLGSSAVDNEKDFKRLEDRLEKGMKADKAQKALDSLNNSIKLSRIEMARHQARIGDYGGAFKTLSSGADTVAKRIAVLGTSISALAVGGAAALGNRFLDTAVKFEKFQIQLKTITGSSEEAEAAMKWITKFTAKTPYELDEVTSSFVKLNAYGLDSSEWMKTLGDTAAAMGKSLDQAVEMFADAAVGEFERLKEFGIKASTEGDTVTFKWSQNGQDMVKTARKTQSGITSALGDIFKRFDGSMDDLSDSWGGMTSNISDIWTQFQNKVMTSGPFEEMKSSLKSFLDYLNSNRGQMDLAGWANDISVSVVDVVNKFQDWIDKNKDFIRQDLPREIKEIASQISSAGGNITDFLGTALNGWNSLPGVVQEFGFIGAAAYGVKGFAILTAGSYLFSEFKDFFDGLDALRGGHISMSEFIGDESEFEEALKRYREIKKYASGALDSIQAIDAKISLVQKEYEKALATPGISIYKSDFDKRLEDLSAYKKELSGLNDLRERFLQNSKSEFNVDWSGIPLPLSESYGLKYTVANQSTDIGPTESEIKAAEKKAAMIASIYQSAYSSLDKMTQATYDAMAAQYQKDYDEFVKLTGDKATAQAIFDKNMADINAKMMGVGTAAQQESAWKSAYSGIDTMTQAVYDKMLTYYGQDYEANLNLLRDKETAHAIYAQKVDALNNKMYGSRVDTALGSFFGEIDDEAKQYSQLMDDGVRVTASMRTEAEKLGYELERLDKMRKIKAITPETYDRAVAKQTSIGFTPAPGLGYSGDEFSALNAQDQELNEWYANQLELLDQYRQQRSDLNATWDERELQLKQQYEDRASQIEQQRYGLALSSASNMFGSMSDLASAYAGEQSDTYRALFAVSKSFAIAEASVKLWQAIANAGASTTWPANLAAMASVAAAMGGLVSNIASVGMAHEGIDSVPKSGTWLLEKGERVTTESTSKRLDTVLTDIQARLANGAGGGGTTVVQSNPKIINLLDKSLVSDYMASGQADAVIINRIKKNASTIKNFLN